MGREDKSPVGCKEIMFHSIFNVKMNLTRKSRYMAGGHITYPTSSTTYASVVSREIVRIVSIVSALNELDILSENIQNSYLNADTKWKKIIYSGDEYKYDQGKVVVIMRDLYGSKTSSSAWRNNLAEVLRNYKGFTSSPTYPDVWFTA